MNWTVTDLVVRSGEFVAEHVDPVDEEMVQPAGVDLRVGSLMEFSPDVFVMTKDTRTPVENGVVSFSPNSELELDQDRDIRTASLDPGVYWIRYEQVIDIPDDHIGLVFPRSTVIRNGNMVNTAVWDPGYTGNGGGRLEVIVPMEVEVGVRIAQLVFIKAEAAGGYNGKYQHENLD